MDSQRASVGQTAGCTRAPQYTVLPAGKRGAGVLAREMAVDLP